MFQLLRSNLTVEKFIVSDKNETLVHIFNIVKNNPYELIRSYRNKWEELQKTPSYFYEQREVYNKTKCPMSFYFLTRTCYNGTIRYNKHGEFNTSHHFGRKGMSPDRVEKTTLYYSSLMKGKDITFLHTSFENIIPTDVNDVVYLDPPYTNTESLYFGSVEVTKLLCWLESIQCSWFMNINGINSKNNEHSLPAEFFCKKTLLSSGTSSFSRLKGNLVPVQEYFYYRLAGDMYEKANDRVFL